MMPISTPEPPVTRYQPMLLEDAGQLHYQGMLPIESGEWVKWSEVEALLRPRAQAIEDLQDALATLQDRHETLQGVAVLRKERAEAAEAILTARAQTIAALEAALEEITTACEVEFAGSGMDEFSDEERVGGLTFGMIHRARALLVSCAPTAEQNEDV